MQEEDKLDKLINEAEIVKNGCNNSDFQIYKNKSADLIKLDSQEKIDEYFGSE